jgi:hypothetical protein
VLDGLPFTMARSIATATHPAAPANPGGPVAVIDWGDSAMTLTIVVDGQPFFTRILRDCELRSLTTTLMRSLNLEAPQCRQLIEFYGFGHAVGGHEAGDMSAVLSDLAVPYRPVETPATTTAGPTV